MFIESIVLSNFRCFGPEETTISFGSGLTVFVGSNGSGKTALMQALLRLFGISNEQRRVRKRDFHIPMEGPPSDEMRLFIEVLLAFPELADDADEASNAVPEFYRQMTIDESGTLKCRIRLEARWVDDGTAEGAIEQEYFVITALGQEFDEDQKRRLAQADRGRIQVIYVPAVRDGVSQVTNALKGRLWKAISWSEDLKTTHSEIGEQLETTFQDETAIQHIVEKVNARWGEVHSAGTDTEVFFSPMDGDFESFVRKVNVGFRPGEDGGDRDFDELSDGQRSLFHIALTSALLDVENEALENEHDGFHSSNLYVPALTLLAIEEPENNLAPFYLSRIIRQIENIVGSYRAQAVLSTHSASTLSRIQPESIRYFRCDAESRLVSVRPLTLPAAATEVGKYVREAVQAYPELYFAKFVILGEGDSELIVLPRLAEALDLLIDPSFVSIVPLGGRHVNHFWRLLNDLEIPHATLLDLDLGRYGGGWGRIRYVCQQLYENGLIKDDAHNRSQSLPVTGNSTVEDRLDTLDKWMNALRKRNVFFSAPLDIDLMMLNAFWDAYTTLSAGAHGPSGEASKAKEAVLKGEGELSAYPDDDDDSFLWYRYLFLGRGKPTTHIAALAELNDTALRSHMPGPLRELLRLVNASVNPESGCDNVT